MFISEKVRRFNMGAQVAIQGIAGFAFQPPGCRLVHIKTLFTAS